MRPNRHIVDRLLGFVYCYRQGIGDDKRSAAVRPTQCYERVEIVSAENHSWNLGEILTPAHNSAARYFGDKSATKLVPCGNAGQHPQHDDCDESDKERRCHGVGLLIALLKLAPCVPSGEAERRDHQNRAKVKPPDLLQGHLVSPFDHRECLPKRLRCWNNPPTRRDEVLKNALRTNQETIAIPWFAHYSNDRAWPILPLWRPA